MSLQNLNKRNNYDIHCKKITARDFDIGEINALDINTTSLFAHDVTSDSVITDSIYSKTTSGEQMFDLSGTEVELYKSIVPHADDGLTLGSSTIRFKTLYVYNLYGPGATFPININKGILINGANVPAPNNQSILQQYFELASIPATPSTLATVSGPFAALQIVNYSATRVGKTVSLKLSFNRQTCTTVSSKLTINNFGAIFNANFVPSINTGFLVNLQVSNVLGQVCLCTITSAGVLTISDISGNNISFANAEQVGLGIPDGQYIQINYNL